MPRAQRTIPWLDQRDGTWYVHWYDAQRGRTQRLSLGTRDDAEAQDRYIAFLQEGRSVLRRPANAGVTVTEAIDAYLREHAGVDPETGIHLPLDGVADRYRQKRAGDVLKQFWADTPISVIDIPESRRYREWRGRCTPVAGPTTVRRELNMLVAAANHAVRWKRMAGDQMPSVELPPHAPVKDAAFLTKDEVRRAIELAGEDPDPRLRAFVVLAYMAGARRKSIERLKVAQADLRSKRLRLTPEGKRVTGKRAPIVPINDDMALEIRKLLLRTDNEWLFGSPGFDVYKRFNRLLTAVGAEDRANPHVLRHSRATHMLQDGVAIWEVAKLLGDTVETVERTYGHHSPDHMEGRASFAPLRSVLD